VCRRARSNFGSDTVSLISPWESDDALRTSEEQANTLRERAAEGAASRVVGVERYEVALAELGQLVAR
jgi:hypothetical protein